MPCWLLYRYWVIHHVYEQACEMCRNKSHRYDDRIVSISQQGRAEAVESAAKRRLSAA